MSEPPTAPTPAEPPAPTLAGDVLLLAVGERAGYRTRGAVGIVVAGALMCGELYAGRPLAGLADDRAALSGALSTRAATAVDEVGPALCASGVLAPYEHRVLGLIVRRGFRVTDPAAYADSERRLAVSLDPRPVADRGPDPGLAALALLCASSGIARAVLGQPPTKQGRKQMADHLNRLAAVLSPDAVEVLLAVRRAYRRKDSGGDVLVPADGGSCYGDTGGGGEGGGDGGGDGGGGGGD